MLAAADEFDGKKDEFDLLQILIKKRTMFFFTFFIKFKILCFHWVSVGRVRLFLNYVLK